MEKSETQLKQSILTQYYRKADQIRGFFGRVTFDIRFPQIKNSLVDRGLLGTIWGLLQWKIKYTNRGIPTDLESLEHQLPITTPNFQNSKDQIKYTWIGHSTAVISFGQDANFLIDPVFAERSSPFQFIGPKRFRPPACSIKQLPRIDVVLVSHDHYDHLDQNALQSIYNRFPMANFVAGLNSEDVFPKKCIMHTLDWTQSTQIIVNDKKFKITFVPVCHWGARWLFDKNKRLWGGFVIETPENKKVFYSGDTGYTGIFKELGQIFNKFDLSILPIGAYTPRQFLRNQHIDPSQAVKVHKEINSVKSVGVHWGTFPLGYEHYLSARQDLAQARKCQGLRDDEFVAIGHGQSFSIKYGPQPNKKFDQAS